MVDSNYDWGQDLDALEASWAALTTANGGKPPHLLYYGFLDPEFMYRMPLAESSLKGFMGRTWKLSQGNDKYKTWVDSFGTIRDTTVGSISALQLDPFGIDMERFRSGRLPNRIGNCFWLTLPDQTSENTADPQPFQL
jgi:hypothetical protein